MTLIVGGDKNSRVKNDADLLLSVRQGKYEESGE